MSIQFIDAQVTVKLEAEPTEDLTVTFISNAAQPAQRVANNSGFTFFNFTMGSVQVRESRTGPLLLPTLLLQAEGRQFCRMPWWGRLQSSRF